VLDASVYVIDVRHCVVAAGMDGNVMLKLSSRTHPSVSFVMAYADMRDAETAVLGLLVPLVCMATLPSTLVLSHG
jgi:hypothetical protein